MVAATRETAYRATIADLDALPDDGRRYELFDGEIFVAASTSLAHQHAARSIFVLLHDWTRGHGGGTAYFAPFDIVFDIDVAQPDIFVLPPGFRKDIRPDNRYGGVPLLVVEVISPSNRTHDTVRKLRRYARAGIPEYWLVDPILWSLDILTLANGGYDLVAPQEDGRVGSLVFPGLVVDPKPLFLPPEDDATG